MTSVAHNDGTARHARQVPAWRDKKRTATRRRPTRLVAREPHTRPSQTKSSQPPTEKAKPTTRIRSTT